MSVTDAAELLSAKTGLIKVYSLAGANDLKIKRFVFTNGTSLILMLMHIKWGSYKTNKLIIQNAASLVCLFKKFMWIWARLISAILNMDTKYRSTNKSINFLSLYASFNFATLWFTNYMVVFPQWRIWWMRICPIEAKTWSHMFLVPSRTQYYWDFCISVTPISVDWIWDTCVQTSSPGNCQECSVLSIKKEKISLNTS